MPGFVSHPTSFISAAQLAMSISERSRNYHQTMQPFSVLVFFFPPPNCKILIRYALNVSLNFSNRHERCRHNVYGRSESQPQRVGGGKANNEESQARARSEHFFPSSANFFFFFCSPSTFPDFLARLLYDRRFRSNLTKIEFYALKHFGRSAR